MFKSIQRTGKMVAGEQLERKKDRLRLIKIYIYIYITSNRRYRKLTIDLFPVIVEGENSRKNVV